MKELNKEVAPAKKKKLLKIFLRAIAITLAVCVVIIGIGIGAYYQFIYDGKTTTPSKELTDKEQEDEDNKQIVSNINQTIAVFGIDEDQTRTDVIFVVNFNSKTNKVKLVSIPRDTKVDWTDAQRNKLQEYKGSTVYTSKINEMTAYGGMENIRDFTIDEIENMIGSKVDNYIIVNLDAFRKIVDAIDGVEVDVPQRMQYTDNAQGLYIDLSPGLQVLDGDKAEQLVRYRQYLNGDVDRIQVQQLFLKAFAQKVMSPQMLPKIPQIVPIIFSSIKTDVSLTEVSKYYPFLQSFNMNYLSFNTIPGEGRYEGGVSYFFPDRIALDTLIEEVFFDTQVAGSSETGTEGEDTEAGQAVVDTDVTIEVLNATGTKGIAGEVKDELEKSGYKVDRIANYTEEDLLTTKIYAKDTKLAAQFKSYFKEASIQVSSSINYDIQIIVGKDYTS
ncbi:MAG: cell envelope-related transcriptional attenuator [Clostridia bacterium]|nr:cell envelope-related transcriptional attenuator [Clostridia bacterium]